jgi:hypothetical protein
MSDANIVDSMNMVVIVMWYWVVVNHQSSGFLPYCCLMYEYESNPVIPTLLVMDDDVTPLLDT